MKLKFNKGIMFALEKIIVLMIILFTLSNLFSCKQEKPVETSKPASVIASNDVTKPLPSGSLDIPRIALYWESTTEIHPERVAWSDFLISKINENKVLSSAQDIESFCPKYKSLTQDQKTKSWGELFVALAYYESAFNPKSQSVDVGTKENKDTWSIGLFQMSVVDIKNYKIQNMKYTFDDLLKAEPNIDLAVAIMAKQISEKKKIVVDSGPYWATLFNGRYPKINEIKQRVQKYAPKCVK